MLFNGPSVIIFFIIILLLIKKICKLDKVVELIGGGCVINGATPSSFNVLRLCYFQPKSDIELVTEAPTLFV